MAVPRSVGAVWPFSFEEMVPPSASVSDGEPPDLLPEYWTLPKNAAEIEQFLAEGTVDMAAVVPSSTFHAPQEEVGTNGGEGTNDESVKCATHEF